MSFENDFLKFASHGGIKIREQIFSLVYLLCMLRFRIGSSAFKNLEVLF